MSYTLTVVTGIPGTRIRRSLAKFGDFAKRAHDEPVTVVSLEDDLHKLASDRVRIAWPQIPQPGTLDTFLLPRDEIRALWADAFSASWARAQSARRDAHVIYTLHLSYFIHLSNEYLLPADLALLSDRVSDANAVVTLADDIYDCHQSLFAGGTGIFQPPRSVESAVFDLLHILDWRSVEVMLTDSLARMAGAPHRIFAVKHPIEAFFSLLYSNKPVVYLSHPISEPREVHSGGHQEETSEFVREMERVVSKLSGTATVLEPTAIDELRFHPSDERAGNLEARWPFAADGRALLWDPPPRPDETTVAYVYPAGWDEDRRSPIARSALIARLADRRTILRARFSARSTRETTRWLNRRTGLPATALSSSGRRPAEFARNSSTSQG